MQAAIRELTERATQAGLVIGEDAARAKLETVLGREGFTGPMGPGLQIAAEPGH
jgi:hypothetical protein